MKPFLNISGLAVALDRSNVDTDLIIPKQYLTTVTRTGLGVGLFSDLRTTVDGDSVEDCVFNDPRVQQQARILVSGLNFGCGSSREHAPWALLDYGIVCVIALSFGDIFYNNCIKNGILPAIVDPVEHAEILQAVTPTGSLAVDLPTQTITTAAGQRIPFHIEEPPKHRLLEGLDDVALTMSLGATIDSFERRHLGESPWLGVVS